MSEALTKGSVSALEDGRVERTASSSNNSTEVVIYSSDFLFIEICGNIIQYPGIL